MGHYLSAFFSSQGFMPHGHCYLWQPQMLLLHVGSDALIAFAYYSIPLTLVYFVRQRKDLEFNWMFLCFAVFILACGTTHLMEIWTVWNPAYWLSGMVKAVTAAASVPTAILLLRLVPLALALPSPSNLQAVNQRLECEISERKKMELALSQRNLELAALNRELEAFSYSVSHDLRAPLRSMDGFALALLEDYDDRLDADGRDALNRIRTASQCMGQLIDDMLRLSKVNRAEIRPESVDLTQMVRETANAISKEDQTRAVEWQVEEGMTIHADKPLLRFAMQNLIENAWKFTGKTARAVIRVGMVWRGDQKTYFVADNGVGFDMSHASRLFGAFQRLHHASEFPGTGIGLAIVQRIIGRHGGEIWAEARQGEGATFFFTVKEPRDVLYVEDNPAG